MLIIRLAILTYIIPFSSLMELITQDYIDSKIIDLEDRVKWNRKIPLQFSSILITYLQNCLNLSYQTNWLAISSISIHP